MEKIDLRAAVEPKLFAAVLEVSRLVAAAGGRAYIVGGAVRDMLLGAKSVKDVDLEVYHLAPEKLQETLRGKFDFDSCGVSFGVLKLKRFDIDVSLPRRESKRGLGHRGFLVASDPELSIPEAASRRDFTVNAMYFDPLAEELIDPYHGREDLAAKVLRHVSPKFAEDPLRVLRGMQFVARFGLEPAPETIEICRAMTPEGLAPERLMEEWSKLLVKGVRISRGLEFLRATGWVKYYPELAALIGCKQAPEWHPEGDVWNHTLCCLDAFACERDEKYPGEDEENLLVALAVLCHDFGKPACTRFDSKKDRIVSRGHDEAGVAPTRAFLARLTNEERLLKEVPPLVQLHMRPFAMWKSHSTDSAIRRLAAKVGRIDRLLRVAAADDRGRPPFPPQPEHLEWLAREAERLAVAAAAPKPIFLGRHLIALGRSPGPDFKPILDAVFEAQLDGKFSDLEGATEYYRRHFAK